MPTIEQLNDALSENVTVVREIHWGGQRIVYEVTVDNDQRVLKLMPEPGRTRAEREVAIGRSFNHPNLSTVLDQELQDVVIDGTTYVFFTETFIDGVPLSSRSNAMDPCEALRLAEDLVSAVSYLWERHHVVHCDIRRPRGQRRGGSRRDRAGGRG
jgi:serine/threonine protein kinase